MKIALFFILYISITIALVGLSMLLFALFFKEENFKKWGFQMLLYGLVITAICFGLNTII